MKKLVLLVCSICWVCAAAAQDPSKLVYSPAQLKADLALAKLALTERHPDLYAYVPKDSLDERFKRIEASLTDSMSAAAAFELFSGVLNNIGCGHTMLAPSADLIKESRKSKRLPFKFKYAEDKKLYIMRSYLDDTTFALGWQLLSVDGHPADQLAERFMRYYSTDGFNQTLKYRQMEAGFRDDYALFVAHPDSMQLECLTRTGEKKSIKVPALPLDTINARYARRYNAGRTREKQLRLAIDSSNVAVLSIGSFHPKSLIKSRQHFKRFVHKAFKEINKKHVTDLVIDLRNNPGGYSNYGIYLYSWLADSSFRYFEKMEVPTKKPISFIKYTDKSYLFNSLNLLISKDRKTGACCYKYDPGLRASHPKKHAFKGNVYVLINGNSFSNSCNFSALAQYHKRAVFIGEETGGRYDGCNGSTYVMVTLPNTEMKLNVPLVKNVYPFPVPANRGHGIMPDHPVQPGIDDAIKGVDAEMKYTMELIKRKHISKK